MRIKLDSKLVSALALAKGQSELFAWDTELQGFGLRLRRRAEGVQKNFVVQYRLHGRSRRHKLGSATQLTLPQAREAARKTLAKITLGGHDPKAERDQARIRAARTFGSTVDLYIAAKAQHVRPATLRATKLYLTGPYFKPLHSAPLAELTRADVAARLTAIAAGHGAITATAARRLLSAFFSWAVQEGLVENNPVIGTRRPPAAPSRDRVLSDAELVAIWNAAGDAGAFGKIIRLLILLGARRTEVGGLPWTELNLEGDQPAWALPAERAKNDRARVVPLPPAAVEIIRAIPRTGPFVFATRGAAGFTAWSAPKRALDERLGDAVKAWRNHDLRRTMRTGLSKLHVRPDIAELCIGHGKKGMLAVYDQHEYQDEIAAALARWANHVEALVAGRTSNVVALKQA